MPNGSASSPKPPDTFDEDCRRYLRVLLDHECEAKPDGCRECKALSWVFDAMQTILWMVNQHPIAISDSPKRRRHHT